MMSGASFMKFMFCLTAPSFSIKGHAKVVNLVAQILTFVITRCGLPILFSEISPCEAASGRGKGESPTTSEYMGRREESSH